MNPEKRAAEEELESERQKRLRAAEEELESERQKRLSVFSSKLLDSLLMRRSADGGFDPARIISDIDSLLLRSEGLDRPELVRPKLISDINAFLGRSRELYLSGVTEQWKQLKRKIDHDFIHGDDAVAISETIPPAETTAAAVMNIEEDDESDSSWCSEDDISVCNLNDSKDFVPRTTPRSPGYCRFCKEVTDQHCPQDCPEFETVYQQQIQENLNRYRRGLQ